MGTEIFGDAIFVREVICLLGSLHDQDLHHLDGKGLEWEVMMGASDSFLLEAIVALRLGNMATSWTEMHVTAELILWWFQHGMELVLPMEV